MMYIQYQFKNGQILYQEVTKYSSLEQKPKNHPLSQKHQHIYVSYICKYVYVACMHTFVAKITTCAL